MGELLTYLFIFLIIFFCIWLWRRIDEKGRQDTLINQPKENSSPENIKVFLKTGVDPEAKTKDTWTPLMRAVFNSTPEAI